MARPQEMVKEAKAAQRMPLPMIVKAMLIRVNRAGVLLKGVKVVNNFTDWINFYIRKTGDSRIKKNYR